MATTFRNGGSIETLHTEDNSHNHLWLIFLTRLWITQSI